MKTNLAITKRSRREPQVGDVVAMRLEGRGWLLGRVISTTARIGPWGGWDGAILLYVFGPVQEHPTVPESLSVDHLLIAPVLLDRSLWRAGYIVFLENREIKDGEKLRQHCFEYPALLQPTFLDENGRRLDSRTDPCGLSALTLLRGLDERLSTALGLSREGYDDLPGNAKPVVDTTSALGVENGDARTVDVAGPCTVSLLLPGKGKTPFDFQEIEEPLMQAVEASGAGQWEGHGFDLETGDFDTRFVGENGQRLLEAIRKAVRETRVPLPETCRAMIQDENGESEFVRL